MRPARCAPFLAALATACTCGAPAPSAPPSPLPDVVIVTLDTTRADHLGAYGYFRDTSPTFDRLAAGSLLFERLVVPMATTLPTHASLFTGTFPLEHGILANVQHGGRRFVPSEGLVPLAAWLADEGYRTAAFVSAAPLNETSGLQRGFGTYDAPETSERRGDATTDAALRWLAQAGADAPLLLWVHYYDPHNPFRPPEPYASMFRGEDGPELRAWLDDRAIEASARRPSGERVLAKPAHNLYDGEIRFMDAQLARLVEALEARGRADRTLLVIMGDHGEGLNQHGEPGHGLVWHEQLHAPLLVRAPGVTPARVPTLLSAPDVLPTALGLVDIPGKDRFLRQASGVDVLAPGFEERPVLSLASGRQVSLGRDMTWALTGSRYKCRRTDDGEALLWDLLDDPHELDTVDRDDDLRACLDAMQATIEAQQARGAALGSGRTEEMSEEQLRHLKLLGYLDDHEER